MQCHTETFLLPNMQQLPAFFNQHQLNHSADERSIKRAYAKALKLIDQEADPAGFQTLRESYEAAVAWLQHRLWRESQEPSSTLDSANADLQLIEPVPKSESNLESAPTLEHEAPLEIIGQIDLPPAARTAPKKIDPTQIAEGVLQNLLANIAANLALEGYALTALRQSIADEQLDHIETREQFEWHLVCHLVNGWQASNGDLFSAAVTVFEWDKDKGRLLRFGERGYVLDRALNELALFKQQNTKSAERQLDIIRKARTEKHPGDAFLRVNIKVVEHMINRYPAWLVLMTSKENIEQWRMDAAQIAQETQVAVNEVIANRKKSHLDTVWQVFFVVLFLGSLVFRFVNYHHEPTAQSRPLATSYDFGRTSNVAPQTDQPRSAKRMLMDLEDKADDYYFGRDGIPMDKAHAAQLMKQAAEKGSTSVQFRLGMMYKEGKGVPVDLLEAHYWLLAAAEQGNGEAQILVSHNFEHGNGTTKDLKQAFIWIKKAAESGNAWAENNLAIKYAYGLGTPKNQRQALYWFTTSAEKNDPAAQCNLGVIYWFGELGVKQDQTKAVELLKLAATKDVARAQKLLGRAYEKGLGGLQVDPERAARWYAKAVVQNDEEAKKWLIALCDSQHLPGCTNYKTAVPSK